MLNYRQTSSNSININADFQKSQNVDRKFKRKVLLSDINYKPSQLVDGIVWVFQLKCSSERKIYGNMTEYSVSSSASIPLPPISCNDTKLHISTPKQ